MAITKVKNYNIAPYYDDYDETKNYHRILFRPGHAVQARELTQLQTALQSQLDKLGQYNFNDGSRVIGGKVTINTEYDFIKLTSTSSLSDFVGYTITGGTNGVTATVLQAVAAAGSDPDTLYIKYTGSGTANATQVFANGETISGGSGGSKTATLASSASTGQGSAASIEEGVYFISGTYVYVATETIILDKYTNTPSYIIGLNVTESYSNDSSSDASLADNAQGAPNYAAPGAHRYKIATALIKESLTAPNTTYSNYIILLKVNSGIIQVKTEDKTANTELTKRLAQRTHEESGNYAVSPYQLDIREDLDDGAGNNGYSLTGSATKLSIGVEPSTSYVQGYRVENLSTKYFTIDKPRSHQNEVDKLIDTPVGNYVKVTLSTVRGMPDINNFITATLADGGGNIGTCRIKGFEEGTNTVWHLYLFDIVMNTDESFSTVTTITQDNPDANHQDFTATLAPAGTLYDAGDDSLVYKLPYNGTRTLTAGSGNPNYKVRIKGEGQVSSTGNNATISFTNFGGTVSSTSDVLISVGNTAPVEVPTACVTSSNTTLTVKNTDGGLNGTGFHTGTPYVQVIWTVNKTASALKTKTLATVTDASISYTSGTPIDLDQSDIKRMTKIEIGGIDASDKFILDNGQRPGFYGEGRLIPVGTVASATVIVSFEYYQHGAGDYFTVDSYDSSEYDSIPTFQGSKGTLKLRDCIDFRPTKGVDPTSASLAFTSGDGESLSDMPKPNGSVTTDISRYLGRIDKLIITKEGEFKVISGVADSRPSAPEAPAESMVLFELHAAPYVFGPKDVIPVRIDNKRYSMRDIGSLDKRIKNLEYYTSLSLLEQEAASTTLFDASNNVRLSNGFIVDGFYGHNLGNVTHKDYSCSIDKSRGILRPKFYEDNINLVRYGSDSGNVVKTGSLLTLPYTHASWISQPYATQSEFVNPYNVFSWTGQLKLSPESDEWKDTETRPALVKDSEGVYDQLVQMAEDQGLLGTVWGEWETNWTGQPVTTTTSTSSNIGQRGDWMWDEGNMWFDRGEEVVTTTTTTTTLTGVSSRTGTRTSIVPDTELTELGERVVETNFIPFIRSRKIYFKAELLKPNTKMYAFFNGRDVTNWCAEESYVEWSGETSVERFKGTTVHPLKTPANLNLISDASGKIEGSFIIPLTETIKFKTGTREFRLTDSSTNNRSNEKTSAEALYHAQGLLEVKQNVILSTKVPKFVTHEVDPETKAVSETSTNTVTTTTYVDPVAQTFLVDQLGGLFATKLDLFVETKDATIPLNVSIRSVVNGIPTQQVVPGSDIIVYPGDINVSANGSSATTVTFDHPIYLAQDQEYAIVLMSMSDDYKVFIAEKGGFDLITPANRVTSQPYDGVFFTSANASTWTPEQNRDLKFTLYRASFSATTGTATLVNDAIPSRKIGANPFHYVSNSTNTIIRVKHRNHGMHGANAKVTFSGFGTAEGIINAAVSASTAVTLKASNSLIAVGQTVTGTGISGSVTVSAISGTSLTLSSAQTLAAETVLTFAATSYEGLTCTNVNTTHTISEQELDSYTITITGDASTSSGVDGGGALLKATEDKPYDILYPQFQTLELPGTGITYSLEGQTGKSVDSSSQVGYVKSAVGAVQANANNEFTAPLVVASTINESNYTTDSSAGNKSLVLTTTFNTITDANDTQYTYLSPVIDLNRASAITISNRMNSATSAVYTDATAGRTFVADTVATGSSNDNKYVTKKIDLNDEADVLDVWLNVNRPSGASVDLYYKVLNAGSELNFDEQAWVLAPPTTPSYIIQNDRRQFSEVYYHIDPTGQFGSFAFKIVLTSTNSANAPLVKDFRAVAST